MKETIEAQVDEALAVLREVLIDRGGWEAEAYEEIVAELLAFDAGAQRRVGPHDRVKARPCPEDVSSFVWAVTKEAKILRRFRRRRWLARATPEDRAAHYQWARDQLAKSET